MTSSGTIEALGGTLEIATSVIAVTPGNGTSGNLEVGNGATLQLDGSTSGQTVLFLSNASGSGSGNLTLADQTGNGALNTIIAKATTGGTFTIQGIGNVDTASGQGINFFSNGGNSSHPAILAVDTTGSIIGNTTGISLVQNGFGNISLGQSGTPLGPVQGNTSSGIFAEGNTSATGGNIDIYAGNVTGGPSSGGIVAQILNQNDNGNIDIHQTGNVSGGQDSIFAQDGCVTTAGNVTTFHPAGTGNVTVTTGTNADITGTSRWGLYADTNGTGSVSVTTQSGTSISSGSSGIVAINQAPASVNFTGASSSINVTANGTIDSGSSANPNGAEPAEIDAGYFNSNAVGSVAVDNYADIEAGNGSGISAFMYGTGAGNVTVNDHAGNITALNAATGVTLGASNPVGIRATSDGTGSITVSTAAGTDINAGSDGILAKNQSTLIPSGSNSQVSVTAHGTIESGTIVNNDGSQPAGILAVYGGNGSSTSSPNTSVYGDVQRR